MWISQRHWGRQKDWKFFEKSHILLYRVNNLPKIIKQLSGKFSMFTCKKHFRCNSLQVTPKVLNKYGSPCWTRTNDLRINRASFYINSRFIAFKNMQFYLNIIAFSQHFKPLYFTRLRRMCSKIVPKFFAATGADTQTRHASGFGGWRVILTWNLAVTLACCPVSFHVAGLHNVCNLDCYLWVVDCPKPESCELLM